MKRERLWAGLFLGPAVFLIAGYLVYPAFVTIYLSFFDRNSTEFVGLDNYVRIFTNNAMLTALKNNLLWLYILYYRRTRALAGRPDRPGAV